jgi:hypothetical protein
MRSIITGGGWGPHKWLSDRSLARPYDRTKEMDVRRGGAMCPVHPVLPTIY